ncbi:hypothetical protein FQ775_11555 [Nitratireductor mangrovi]|uniref:TonB C-terminal domain-containing protein n=1 Tax=Nitratireductor mangrovi TaxID=2599600 RepID=A0A5B8KZ80_9HYPH|nr:hypothetical protein [Nitratireductor mangrovi]QDZ00965.1 hypothetical protein FQ775_11555 [Nitratireductor mangrovi]
MGVFFRIRRAILRAAAVAGISIAGSVAQADPPRPPAKASIGDITFNFDPSVWQFASDGDGLVATCVGIDCRGVVIDISQRPSEGGCTKDFVRETARRMFPWTDRHAVNTLAAGRFGLVLSQSRLGPNFDVPSYVFACLDWQGTDYRFAIRPETVGEISWTGGALHYLVSRASAPPARIERVRLGAMTLEIRTNVWDIATVRPNESAMLICRPPTCHDRPFVIVSASSGIEPQAAIPPFGRGWRDSRTEIYRGDHSDAVTFSVTTTFSPCRNYVPPEVVAAAHHGGMTYRISTPALTGCRSARAVSGRVFEALLDSARIVDTGAP